jgi:hypothetical protein
VPDTNPMETPAPETPSPRVRPPISMPRLLWAAAAAWVAVCFFALIPAGITVEALAMLLRRATLANATWFGIVVEAAVHLFLAGAVFGLLRGLHPPRWFWLVGPAGYLGSALLFGLVLFVLGDTLSVPHGAEWGFVAADTLATSAGAWLGLLGSSPAAPDRGTGPGVVQT